VKAKPERLNCLSADHGERFATAKCDSLHIEAHVPKGFSQLSALFLLQFAPLQLIYLQRLAN